MSEVKTKTKIRIKHDVDYDTSDLFMDDYGTFAACHRRLDVGRINGDSAVEFLEDVPEGALKIPIYLYEHGGIALSTGPFSCPWDSGQVGLWVFTTEDLVRLYGEDTEEIRQKARKGVDGAVQYLTDVYGGNVWGFEIEDFDGEVADSCWGFVGDDALEGMKEYVPENLHESLTTAWENR